MNIKKPPKYAEKFLRLFLPKRDREFLLSDFDYLYQEVFEKRGNIIAGLWYWLVVLKAIPSFINNQVYWGSVMLKSYLKLALRNLLKRKVYSFINIFGLSTGIACSVIMFGYVQDELSYDSFHENAEDLYIATFINGSTTTPTALAGYLKSEYPEVIKATRWTPLSHSLLASENIKAFQDEGAVVDPDFLSMFSIKIISGDIQTVLSKPRSVLISEGVAAKYFSTENPVGKTLNYENQYEFLITGVFEDYPDNSHIRCSFIIPNSFTEELGRNMNTWEYNNIQTYIQLNRNSSVASFNKSISDVVEKHRAADKREMFMQPIIQFHLNPFNLDGGTLTYIYMFSILALLILIIACINFVNLTTAKSTARAREVGIRKTIGARRGQLIYQFFGESILITLFSFLFAIILVFILLPYFNELASKNFTLDFIFKQGMIYGILGILFLTGILSGSYPALFLSRFKPVKVLKGNREIGHGGTLLRKVLVVTQFSSSVLLIIFSLIVFRQVNYLKEKNVGFESENIIYFGIGDKFKQNYDTIKNELLANPKVENISLVNCAPYRWVANAGYGDVSWEGKTGQWVKMVLMSVDTDYLETFGLKMNNGRFFSDEHSTDTKEAYVINEAAAKAMELQDPVGKWLKIGEDNRKIIGVVEDYHFESLKNEIIPMAMLIDPDWYYNACLKISPTQISATINFIESKWKMIYPDYPFEYQFLDETLRDRYNREEVTGRIVFSFTLLALIISCLGLFGLSSYTAEQKTKEIGIRKVLGASALSIVKKMSKEFFYLVLISNLVAWPVAYYLAQKWLQDFAYRTSISYWLFIYTLLAAMLLTLATISWQIVKAAMANPVDALKNE